MQPKTNARRRLAAALAVGAFCAAASVVGAQETEPETPPASGVYNINYRLGARDYFRRRQWQNLLAHTEKWAREEPDNWRARYYRGVAFNQLGDYAAAVGPLAEARARNPAEQDAIDAEDARAFYELARYAEAEPPIRRLPRARSRQSRQTVFVAAVGVFDFAPAARAGIARAKRRIRRARKIRAVGRSRRRLRSVGRLRALGRPFYAAQKSRAGVGAGCQFAAAAKSRILAAAGRAARIA